LSIVSATATPSLILAGRGSMAPVTINVVTTGSNVMSKIVSITSNQGNVGAGQNAEAQDAVITGNLTALLRADLPNNVNVDRVYNILIESVDQFGNVATTTVQAIVPHTVGTPATQSTFNTRQVFSAGALINGGSINSGVIAPDALNTGGAANTTSPFSVNLATP
ncbi:MAG: hypothetical protein JWO95_1577, partial [Verrucomicrobiales bacterium]|nr:hypothetical protein [Verrucomicrobiales bacterium]